jgi:acetyltransferase-like isoleucine patch superfamily enzyme
MDYTIKGNVSIHPSVFIGEGTYIDGYHEGVGIRVCRGSWIGQQCYFHGAGGIVIGECVGVGPGVKIFTSFHGGGDGPIIHRRLEFRPVSIQRGADIGVGAIILPGVTIGEYAQVGAGAVVTKDVDAMSVVAGNPARVI